MASHRGLAVGCLAAAVVAVMALAAAAQTASSGQVGDGNKSSLRRTTELLHRLDADHDGKLTLAETDAFALSRFDRLDRGDKGYLTLDDFRVRERDFLDDAGARRNGGGKAMPRYEVAFRAINKAGDGHITKEEYLAASRARFAAADTDKSGTLTVGELHAAKGKGIWGLLVGILWSGPG